MVSYKGDVPDLHLEDLKQQLADHIHIHLEDLGELHG